MIAKMLLLLALYAMLIFQPKALATGDPEGEGEEHHQERAGKEKALAEVNEEKGFKLSPESVKAFGIETQAIDPKSPIIPKSSYVAIKNKKGIYLFRDGFFKFVEFSPKNFFLPGDRVVTSGMGIIAITDVYSKDESEYGHSH